MGCDLIFSSYIFLVFKLVERVLEQKPGGDKILAEYATKGQMKDRTRRELVNTVVADMLEKYGYVKCFKVHYLVIKAHS